MNFTFSSKVSLKYLCSISKNAHRGFGFSLKDYLVKILISRFRKYASEVILKTFVIL